MPGKKAYIMLLRIDDPGLSKENRICHRKHFKRLIS
jgi:hypothetical protein